MKNRKNRGKAGNNGNGVEPANKTVNDPGALNTSIEIPLYAPNRSIGPKEYMLTAQLVEFEAGFEETCRDFLEKANPDEYNSSYMDALIERICDDAVKYINIQRNDHVFLITKLLDDMHKGDLIKCRSKLECYRRLKEENEKELHRYRRVLYQGTSLED